MLSRNTPPAVANRLSKRSTEHLINQVIETGKMIDSGFPNSDIYEVRGWLLDELNRRNPEAFSAWVDCFSSDDSDLFKFFVGEAVPF
jgi:hypothetical protein